MKKYHVENCGFNDVTEFDVELTDEELKIIIRLFELNNEESDYYFKPSIYVYEFRDDNDYWRNVKPLNH